MTISRWKKRSGKRRSLQKLTQYDKKKEKKTAIVNNQITKHFRMVCCNQWKQFKSFHKRGEEKKNNKIN